MKARNLIPVLLVLVGCSEPMPRNVDTLVQQGDMYLDGETMLPYSGPIFLLREDDSSKVQVSTTLKDGLFHGPWESYYYNGQLRRKTTYSNGELDGLFEQYNENGQLSEKISYSNGEFDGPFERYDENGQVEDKGSISNGERCGEWTEEGENVTYDPCPSN